MISQWLRQKDQQVFVKWQLQGPVLAPEAPNGYHVQQQARCWGHTWAAERWRGIETMHHSGTSEFEIENPTLIHPIRDTSQEHCWPGLQCNGLRSPSQTAVDLTGQFLMP